MAGTCCFLQQVELVVVVLVVVELLGVCSLVLLDQVDGEASSSTAGGKKLNNWRAASPSDPPMVKSYTPLVTRVCSRCNASALICFYLFAPPP